MLWSIFAITIVLLIVSTLVDLHRVDTLEEAELSTRTVAVLVMLILLGIGRETMMFLESCYL
jgi:hypothetical protein